MATTKTKAAKPKASAQADAQASAAPGQGAAAYNGNPPGPEANLWQRLHWVMANLGYLPKEGVNDFHRYRYTTEADTVEAVRRLLVPARLAFTMRATETVQVRDRPTKSGTTQVTSVLVEFTLVNIDQPEDRYSTTLWAEGEDPADKGFWKAYSGAVKYFWFKHLLIATGKDDPEATGTPGVGEQGNGGQPQGQPQPAAPDPAQVSEWRHEALARVATLRNTEGLAEAVAAKLGVAEQTALDWDGQASHVLRTVKYLRTVCEAMGVTDIPTENYEAAEDALAQAAKEAE